MIARSTLLRCMSPMLFLQGTRYARVHAASGATRRTARRCGDTDTHSGRRPLVPCPCPVWPDRYANACRGAQCFCHVGGCRRLQSRLSRVEASLVSATPFRAITATPCSVPRPSATENRRRVNPSGWTGWAQALATMAFAAPERQHERDCLKQVPGSTPGRLAAWAALHSAARRFAPLPVRAARHREPR